MGVCTLLIPRLAWWGGGWVLAARFLCLAAYAFLHPTVYNVVSLWIPARSVRNAQMGLE